MTDDWLLAMRRCLPLLILGGCIATLASCSSSVGVDLSSASSCNSSPTVAREWPSPDGKRKIVQEQFDCPGWYALNLEISNPDGTKAIALMDRPADQVRPTRWPELKVDWKSNSEVWITYPARQDTTCMSKAGEIQVHCLDAAVAR